MQAWLRFLLVLVILFSATSFFWFLLGATAFFQRGMDIIGTTYFFGAAIPVLLFAIVFTIILIKGWAPTSGIDYVGICIGLVLATLISAALIQSVNTHGWANEKIVSDSIKVTIDGQYEYCIDLINLFQRNSHARLYLKDLSLGKETIIPVDIQTSKIVGLGVKKVNHWVMLEPTNTASEYILYTTEELGIPEEKFEIDIRAGKSIRLK
ncbi:hypothetical protein [Paenibacillus alvei]|uniref:hypothetical protein n=1 Tax=Paenibacillus alvei TaxID=44250 RepID=UPI0018CCB338|nr:hypothetical protein [Paenibacillus alvei]MBG9734185.1 hypothetical protein [Paenibacillus alvei]MBG9744550.1 hypothetical protein [Paenibacillus alvei]MCY9581747.1 hypothetical protein [Paenibacillus alvei]MCY9588346.1 hypothetical protein [Paenibacillus alvei]